jgi:hypothetical protein
MFYRLAQTFDPQSLKGCATSMRSRFGKLTFRNVEHLPGGVRSMVASLRPDRVRWMDARPGELPPHRDRYVNLNIYASTGGGITRFWRQTEGAQHHVAKGLEFDLGDMQEVASFEALPGDAYLLSAREFHSVSPDAGIDRREMLQLVWERASYESVLTRLREYEAA